MTFEIIKNAEIPQDRRGRQPIYPFAQMEVGDGFDAPRDKGVKGKKDLRLAAIYGAAAGYRAKYNSAAKFAIRILDENTVRCVRIA